jgi:hypothetical protein
MPAKQFETSCGHNARMDRPRDHRLLIIGALVAAGGFYFMLIGFDLVTRPGRINGPMWLSALAGLVFMLGGICVALRGWLGMDDSQRELPADAPLWAKLTFWGSGVAITCALASIGTWIAWGEGMRGFTSSGVINGPVSDAFGRAVFGTGAIMTWLAALAFARAGYRKVFGA